MWSILTAPLKLTAVSNNSQSNECAWRLFIESFNCSLGPCLSEETIGSPDRKTSFGFREEVGRCWWKGISLLAGRGFPETHVGLPVGRSCKYSYRGYLSPVSRELSREGPMILLPWEKLSLSGGSTASPLPLPTCSPLIAGLDTGSISTAMKWG